MWSSANGSGIRTQSTPGATSVASPGAGGAACGNSRGIEAFMGRRGKRGAVEPYGIVARSWGDFLPRQCVRSPMPSPRPPDAPGRTTYSISDLAREFALTTRAIRFYEDCGLVRPDRHGRARIYGERERVRIKLILRGKRLGLSLAEIGDLLDLYEVARNERAQLAKFLVLLDERRARLLQPKED